MGVFDSSFTKTISTPIPADISIEHFQLGVEILQNYENVAHFSTNCKGCKRLQSSGDDVPEPDSGDTQNWEVSEDLPFIPSWLWSGGTTYHATVTPDSSGCEVKIRASSLYTSTNQWKVVRGSPPADDEGMQLPGSQVEGSEWYIQTASETVCSKTFVSFVKGNLVKGTRGMHEKFIEKLREEVRKKGSGAN